MYKEHRICFTQKLMMHSKHEDWKHLVIKNTFIPLFILFCHFNGKNTPMSALTLSLYGKNSVFYNVDM